MRIVREAGIHVYAQAGEKLFTRDTGYFLVAGFVLTAIGFISLFLG
jgi:hypothetical protein